MINNVDIPPNNYVYGIKFNTYIKYYKKSPLILLYNTDDRYIFNFLTDIWKTDLIHNDYIQIITIPSKVKIYYNGTNYYCNNITIKNNIHISDIINNPNYTEDIIKNYGMAIIHIHPLNRTQEIIKLAIKNDINAIVHCYMYENLDKELYKHPKFIKNMIGYIPEEIIEKLLNKKGMHKYLMNKEMIDNIPKEIIDKLQNKNFMKKYLMN